MQTKKLTLAAVTAAITWIGTGLSFGQFATLPPAAAPQGAITVRLFQGTGTQPAVGAGIASLTGHPSFPDSPTVREYSPRFEWPTTADGSPPPGNSPANGPFPWDNYGIQIIGYFYPPTSGNYTFAIASDDGGQLFLSTDATAANKALIATEPTWNGVRNFDGIDRRTIVDAVTSRYINVSPPIALVANRAYYIEAISAEGGGGDSLAVTYTTDGSFPLNGADPIAGAQLRSIDRADGALTAGTPPASQTIPAGSPVTFTVGVPTGTPPYSYAWLRDGADIVDANGAPIIAQSYSIPRVTTADNNAKFSVRITNPAGTITTAVATLTVTTDNVAPTMTKVGSGANFASATITYSEPMGPAAITPSNYTFSGGLTATAAEFLQLNSADPADFSNFTVVKLTTSTQADAATYDMTVNVNVKDQAGNSVSPNTAKLFANTFKTGVVANKRWLNFGSRDFAALLADPVAYANPSAVFVRNLVEEDDGDIPNAVFPTTLEGFFIPATTGDYVFYLSVDNDGWFYLSNDENPANQVLVAADIGWQNARTWTGAGGDATKRRGDTSVPDPGMGPFENRSDQMLTSIRGQAANWGGNRPFTDVTVWPTLDANGNAKITLTAGKKYSFTVYHSEPESGNSGVTFKAPGETADPANGSASRMTGALIGAVVDPSALSPIITQNPTNIDFTIGSTLTFSVGVDSPLTPSYQWRFDGTAIAGETNATLTIANAGVSNVGGYSVVVTNRNGAATSTSAFAYTAAPAPGKVFTQDAAGLVVMEAENYFSATRAPNGQAWVEKSARADASGGKYMQALADAGNNNNNLATVASLSPILNFKVNFSKTGLHYLWMRAGDPTAGGAGDSVYAGLNGAVTADMRGNPTFNTATWAWVGQVNGNTPAILDVATAGEHLVSVIMREDGLLFDKILLTTDAAFVPTGTSPAESTSTGGTVTPTISVAKNAAGGPVITFTGVLHSSATVDGTYAPVAGATSPYTAPTTAAQQFFKSK